MSTDRLWALTDVSQLPPSIADLPAVDLETDDLGLSNSLGPGWCIPGGGHVVGIAVAADNWQGYIPLGHDEGINLPIDTVVRWYKEVILHGTTRQIYANAQYDYGWLRTLGIITPYVPHDVLVQAPLINEHAFSYDLDSITKLLLPELGGKVKTKLLEDAEALGIREKDIIKKLRRFSPEAVGEYAVQDTVITKAVFWRQHEDIVREELQNIYDMETRLIPMLVEMRDRGVRVDTDRAERIAAVWKRVEDRCVARIRDRTGITLEKFFSAKELATVLDHQQIPYGVTAARGQPQIDQELLKKHADNEVMRDLLDLRKFNRARETFIQGFIIDMSRDGRLHGSFNPLKSDEGGTISGRFSSSAPNLQQIPARDPVIGPAVRSCFVPEDGCTWGCLDYSQQEPRNCVSMAYRMGYPSAIRMRKRFIEDPTTDFHDENTVLTGLDKKYGWESGRKKAKNIGLGLMYSMGGAKLCWQLGLPTEMAMRFGRMMEVPGKEGAEILSMFHDGAPYIRELSRVCVKAAKSRGWIKTPMGRKFRFPFRNNEYFKSHKALNALIQGMSADEMKKAMLDIYDAGFLPALTVHDELDFTNIANPDDFRIPVELMLRAMVLPVPSKVDLEIGSSWGKIKKYQLPDLPLIYSET